MKNLKTKNLILGTLAALTLTTTLSANSCSSFVKDINNQISFAKTKFQNHADVRKQTEEKVTNYIFALGNYKLNLIENNCDTGTYIFMSEKVERAKDDLRMKYQLIKEDVQTASSYQTRQMSEEVYEEQANTPAAETANKVSLDCRREYYNIGSEITTIVDNKDLDRVLFEVYKLNDSCPSLKIGFKTGYKLGETEKDGIIINNIDTLKEKINQMKIDMPQRVVPEKTVTQLSEEECDDIAVDSVYGTGREVGQTYKEYISIENKLMDLYEKLYTQCKEHPSEENIVTEKDYDKVKKSIQKRLTVPREQWEKKWAIRMINTTGSARDAGTGWGPAGDWAGPDFSP